MEKVTDYFSNCLQCFLKYLKKNIMTNTFMTLIIKIHKIMTLKTFHVCENFFSINYILNTVIWYIVVSKLIVTFSLKKKRYSVYYTLLFFSRWVSVYICNACIYTSSGPIRIIGQYQTSTTITMKRCVKVCLQPIHAYYCRQKYTDIY